jgi:hypothetical protein
MEVLKSLYKEMARLGYPEGALRKEVPINFGNTINGYIDLAVIDQESDEIIAIIEVKRGSRNLSRAANQNYKDIYGRSRDVNLLLAPSC